MLAGMFVWYKNVECDDIKIRVIDKNKNSSKKK
jgi:hypothetical protein